MRYPKINTLWQRNQNKKVKRKGVIYEGLYSEEAFGNIRKWTTTEKIDGENLRIHIDFIPGNAEPPHIWVGSRNDTETPNINEDVLSYIKTHINTESLMKAFTNGSLTVWDCPMHAMIFGEAFGGNIHHGHDYRITPSFIIFDIVVDGWWLEHKNTISIANKLGIPTVPVHTQLKTIEQITKYVKSQPDSIIAENPHVTEGVVCTSSPLLLTRNGFPLRFKLKTKDYRDLESLKERIKTST